MCSQEEETTEETIFDIIKSTAKKLRDEKEVGYEVKKEARFREFYKSTEGIDDRKKRRRNGYGYFKQFNGF